MASDVWGQDALDAYARRHGLTFEGEGLLPAATDFLRRGLGAGEHRAGVIVKETAHSVSSTGGLSKKPERHTMNITRGRLPGGLEGLIAHHFHLEYRDSGGEGGRNWLVVPHTVVFAYVPEAARVAREVKVTEPGEIRAGAAINLSGDAVDPVIPGTGGGEQIDGWVWRTDPPEDPRDVQELARGIGPMLSSAPYGTLIELRDGSLCGAAKGVIEDPAQLDQLCLLASAVVDGARRTAALHPPFDPTTPTRKQVLPPDLKWVDALTAQIAWPEPPASVPAAQAAYAALAGRDHGQTRRKVSLIALMALFAVGVIWFSIDALIAFAFHDYSEAVIGAIIGICGIPFAISAARRAGKETADDQVAARSKLPGLEAFVREYARSRVLALEDRDEFRRRFASPMPGAPLKVMYGLLGGEVSGRLVLWMARDERWQMHYWNMAVVPAPDGADLPSAPGYQVMRAGGAFVLAEPVQNEGRSIERLDALREVAVNAVKGSPALTH
jgi:hypothetical protein